jgi:hypothetical protein
MSSVTLNSEAVSRLNQLTDGGDIHDEAGRLVGFFSPARDLANYEVIDPPSDDELDRIEQYLDGRPLADIMRDLRAQ